MLGWAMGFASIGLTMKGWTLRLITITQLNLIRGALTTYRIFGCRCFHSTARPELQRGIVSIQTKARGRLHMQPLQDHFAPDGPKTQARILDNPGNSVSMSLTPKLSIDREVTYEVAVAPRFAQRVGWQ